MRDNITLELNPEQRQLLLDGLRFVRSSVALEILDWTPEVEANRDRQYTALSGLEDLLNGVSPAEKHANV